MTTNQELLTFIKETQFGFPFQQQESLSPRWEGDWTIQEVKSAVTMKITNGHHSKVVHINRLRHRIQKQPEEIEEPQGKGKAPWAPPKIEHLIIPSDPPERHNPLGDRHPPDRLQF